MDLALTHIRQAQRTIGGRFVYLECADNPFLIDFYEKQEFFYAGKRYINKTSYLLCFLRIVKQ